METLKKVVFPNDEACINLKQENDITRILKSEKSDDIKDGQMWLLLDKIIPAEGYERTLYIKDLRSVLRGTPYVNDHCSTVRVYLDINTAYDSVLKTRLVARLMQQVSWEVYGRNRDQGLLRKQEEEFKALAPITLEENKYYSEWLPTLFALAEDIPGYRSDCMIEKILDLIDAGRGTWTSSPVDTAIEKHFGNSYNYQKFADVVRKMQHCNKLHVDSSLEGAIENCTTRIREINQVIERLLQ